MASRRLKHKLNQYSVILASAGNKKNRCPATIIGAEHGNRRKVDSSGIPPSPMAQSLQVEIQNIGTIGSRANNNTLGCCSEVRASNQILIMSAKIQIINIRFTNAIRPRTGQIIARCKNCTIVFG